MKMIAFNKDSVPCNVPFHVTASGEGDPVLVRKNQFGQLVEHANGRTLEFQPEKMESLSQGSTKAKAKAKAKASSSSASGKSAPEESGDPAGES